METKGKDLTASLLQVEVMPTESEVVAIQPLGLKTKTEYKTTEEKKQRLAALAKDTQQRLKRSALDIYYIGLNLLEAQSIMEHGEFLPWLRQEFGMGKTSAYEFIHVTEAFQSKIPIIGNLINGITPTALYKLAAPSTSEAARDEAIARVKAGELVDPDIAKELIKKHKPLKTSKTQQQKAVPTTRQSAANQVEASALLESKCNQLEWASKNFVASPTTPQQDELQRVVAERDNYKAQLEASCMRIKQLELDISQLHSELALLRENL